MTLDGSASSDPNGDPLSYQWEQIGGPAVALSDPTAVRPGFAAPSVPRGGATLTFQLTVFDGTHTSEADTVDITVKNLNQAPVADAGDDQTVQEGSPVTLHGGESFDPDSDPFTYQWAQTAGPEVSLSDPVAAEPTFTAPLVGAAGETLAFALTVSDGFAVATDEVVVVVSNVNQAPHADAGSDQTVDESTAVTLDGSASSDPDGGSLSYSWTQRSGPPVTLSDPGSARPRFMAPAVCAGRVTLVFQLIVSDGMAASPPDTVSITVLAANQPPVCGLARPRPRLLWPPNHKLVPVFITGVADPDDRRVRLTVTAVTQDEPVNGLGDGDTSPDAVLAGASVLLRAEGAGGGTGRVYRVTFIAEDAGGATCTGSVLVCVPHDRRTTSASMRGSDTTRWCPEDSGPMFGGSMKNAIAMRSRYSMVCALVLTGLWPSPAPANDGPTPEVASEHHSAAPGHRTPGGAFVEVVRNATRRFQDVSAAEAAGYALHFGCVSGSDVGAMGLHYVNMDLVMDPALDATRPEIVIYEPTSNGRLRLIGADYLVLKDAWHATNPAPPELMGQLFHLFESPNRFGLPDFYTLHVWAWKENPSGTFVNWHPNVSCEKFSGQTH